MEKQKFELGPIDFISDMGITLWPVQKFIIKLLHGIELCEGNEIEIMDYPISNYIKFSEPDLLNYLCSNKMCNINYDKYEELRKEGKKFTEALFLLGCRSGKSALANLIMLYRIAQLYYIGLPADDFNSILEVIFSQNICQSSDTLHNITYLSQQSKYLSYPAVEQKIKLWLKSCSSKTAIRGRLCHTAILDDASEYKAERVEEIYYGARPAMAPFAISSVPVDLRHLFMTITSLNKNSIAEESNFIYTMFLNSFDNSDTLMLRLPSWFVNPNLSFDSLQEINIADPVAFKAEFESQFILNSENKFV